MVAALYITYGPLITMIYSAGKGAHEFVLDREGEYVLSEEKIQLKEKGSIFSPGGLRKDWTDAHLKFIEKLEQDGYVLREIYAEVPPRVEYQLTPQGRSFLKPMKALVAWADTNHVQIVEARGRINARAVE